MRLPAVSRRHALLSVLLSGFVALSVVDVRAQAFATVTGRSSW
jgi:hypothetical protein